MTVPILIEASTCVDTWCVGYVFYRAIVYNTMGSENLAWVVPNRDLEQ